jgi:lipopolysaccharide export system protein LptA
MNKKKCIIALFLFISYIACAEISRSTTPSSEEIQISSIHADIQQNQETKKTCITYKTTVQINWKTLELKTENLTLEINKEVTLFICPSQLTIIYEDLQIQADRADGSIDQQIIKLHGNVIIKKKIPTKHAPINSITHADSMIIHLKTKKTELLSDTNRRVKTIISNK